MAKNVQYGTQSAEAEFRRRLRGPPEPSKKPPASRTYVDALDALNSLASNKQTTGMFAGLDPKAAAALNERSIQEMRSWLSRAGITHDDLKQLRVIHVAGTKGKGSTCHFATSILLRYPTRAGKVGTYTSPHLISPRERIMLNGQPISQRVFTRYFFELWDKLAAAAAAAAAPAEEASQGLPASQDGPTPAPALMPAYFRFMTLLALRVFLGERVRSAVVECGIGGRHDATNIFPAEAVTATVVTPLGRDHVDMLGGTDRSIAAHKAGIMKPGVKAIVHEPGPGRDPPSAIFDEAYQIHTGRPRLEPRPGPLPADAYEPYGDEAIRAWQGIPDAALRADYQKTNMTLAAAAARHHLWMLGERWPLERGWRDFHPAAAAADFPLGALPPAFSEALRETRVPGRAHVVSAGPVRWFLDGAHTVESIREAAAWFHRSRGPGRPVLVFNQQDRPVEPLLRELLTTTDTLASRDLVPAAGTADLCTWAGAVFTRNDLFRPGPGAAGGEGEGEGDVDTTKQVEASHVFLQHVANGAIKPGAGKVTSAVVGSIEDMMETIHDEIAWTRPPGEDVSIFVTGSLHLVGAVLQYLQPQDA